MKNNISLKAYARHLFYNGAKSVRLTIEVEPNDYEYKVVHTYKDFLFQWNFTNYMGYKVVDVDIIE